MAVGFGRGGARASALSVGLLTSGPALSAQGVAVGDGTATPVEQAIAFILSLPITLVLIGLGRGR